MSPLFNVIDKMLFEEIKNFTPALSNQLTTFTFYINAEALEDQLFKEQVKLIEELTRKERSNKRLDKQIKKIMYTLMTKHGYSKHEAYDKLYKDLSISLDNNN